MGIFAVSGRVREGVRTAWEGLWLLPSLIVVGLVALVTIAIVVDHATSSALGPLSYGGEPPAARGLLSTIASSMVTVMALVFSITVVAVQLASSQYSPRVLGEFLDDRVSQATLGSFIGTFVIALLTLLNVHSSSSGASGSTGFVPGTAIMLTIAFALVSLALFVTFIHRMTATMRSANLVARVADRTVRAASKRHDPQEADSEDGFERRNGERRPVAATGAEMQELCAPVPGVLSSLGVHGLAHLASQHDVVVSFTVASGTFLPKGAPFGYIWARTGSDAASPDNDGRSELDRAGADVVERVGFATEQTIEDDPMYGMRQIADIALRALSPGVNDPTTAVQALDRLHDLLRRLAGYCLGSVSILEADGNLCVFVPGPEWNDYLWLAIGEVIEVAGTDLQVQRRIRAMFADLAEIATPSQRLAIDAQLTRLDTAADDASLPEAARRADPRGFGSGPDTSWPATERVQ